VTTVVILIDAHNLEAMVTMVITTADLAMVDTVAVIAVAMVTADLDMVVTPNSLLTQHYCRLFNAVKNVI